MVSDSAGNLFSVLAHRMAAGGNGPKTVITLEGALADGAYFLYRQPTVDHRKTCAGKSITAEKHMLKNKTITVHLYENGHVQDVTAAGVRVLDPGSLVPFILYDGRRLVPDQLKVTVLEDGTNGSAATGTFAVFANPFGTYDGRQHVPPTRGNRLGYETTMLSGPQFHNAGPTFNGYKSRFAVMVAFFEGDSIPGDIKEDLIGYARPLVVIMAGDEIETTPALVPNQEDHPPAGLLALPYDDGVLFHWEKVSDRTDIRYRLVFKDANNTFTRKIETRETTLFVSGVPIIRHAEHSKRSASRQETRRNKGLTPAIE